MKGGVFGAVVLAIIVALALSGQAQAAVTCDGKPVSIKGSNGDNVIKGTKKNDVIAGRGGDDTIKAKGGDDTVCGGDGIDKLVGAAGVDRLFDDSPGADTLIGGSDLDVCTVSVGDTVDCDFTPEDPVIFARFQKPPSPASLDVKGSSELERVDVYTILDRSGSMSSEITTIKNNLATVVSGLQCGPGEEEGCIPDLWAGAGTVGYAGTGGAPFTNHVDVQPNPNFSSVATTEPGGCCDEPLTFSVFAAITGSGGASYGLTAPQPRSTCAGSPAQNAGYGTFGYPCFRTGALPVVVLATDEAPISPGQTYKNPNWATVVKPAMTAVGARFIGILGSSPATGTQTDLQAMATDTGAVDATNGNAPLVFDGADANAAAAIGNGIRAFVDGVPLDVGADPRDDPSDSVDAVTAFIDHVEVLESGTEECPSGFNATDTDADSFDDRFSGVPAGSSLCWKVVARQNTTVQQFEEPQLFRVTVAIEADQGFPLDEHDIFFAVPAARR